MARRLIAPGVILLLLALLPQFSPPAYVLVLCTGMFMRLALAEAWILLGGYAGYHSLGHIAFFGLGGYTTGMLLLQFGLSPFLTFPVAGAVAGVFALLVAYPLLKVRGPYFVVITLLTGLVVGLIIKNLPYFGGASGVYLPIPKLPARQSHMLFYYVMLGFALLATAVAYVIEHSKLGAGLVAVRENEDVAEAVAVQTTQVKMLAFVLSAVITGLVGGIYSYWRTYVSPETVFDLQLGVSAFLMALFGGADTWLGPILGTVVLTAVGEVVTFTLGPTAAKVTYGLFLMLVILAMPQGLLQLVRRFGPMRAKATEQG